MNESTTPTPAEIAAGEKIGRAIARDARADDMPREWTGLDPQDAAEIPEGCRPEVVESVARGAYLREMDRPPAPAGYVLTTQGTVYVQAPAENRWGFSLFDECESYPGGHGLATEWTLLADDDPRVTEADRERLGWILDEARAGA